MADNVTTQSSTLSTLPDGTQISADEDVTNGLVQRMKLAYSADGVSTHVTADDDGLMVQIGADVEASFDHGRNSDIDTIAEQITTSSIAAARGVLVKADNANTANIFVGNSDVTADSADATDGFQLGAGESVIVKVDNANKIYVIAAAINQAAYWMTV